VGQKFSKKWVNFQSKNSQNGLPEKYVDWDNLVQLQRAEDEITEIF